MGITGIRIFADACAITRMTIAMTLATASSAGFPSVAGATVPYAAPTDHYVTGDIVECCVNFAAGWVEHNDAHSTTSPPTCTTRSATRSPRRSSAGCRDLAHRNEFERRLQQRVDGLVPGVRRGDDQRRVETAGGDEIEDGSPAASLNAFNPNPSTRTGRATPPPRNRSTASIPKPCRQFCSTDAGQQLEIVGCRPPR